MYADSLAAWLKSLPWFIHVRYRGVKVARLGDREFMLVSDGSAERCCIASATIILGWRRDGLKLQARRRRVVLAL